MTHRPRPREEDNAEEKKDVVRLEDLAPRKDVTGGAKRKLRFGEASGGRGSKEKGR